MLTRLLLFLAILAASTTCYADPEGTLIVKLPTDNQLLNVYVPPLINQGATLSPRYQKELHQIMEFDLGHNGMTRSVTPSSQSRINSSTANLSYEQINLLKQEGIHHIVHATLSNKRLEASITSVNSALQQSISPVELTGDIDKDRNEIHKISDAIHEALFGSPGIASTRFLYTVKNRQSSDSSHWTSEVWEADYDGQNARQITRESALCITPTYVPPSSSGNRASAFLFVSYKTGQPKIYIANLRDGIGHRFSYLPGNQMMPAITTNRDKVLFISDVASNPDLYLQPFNPEVGAMGKPQQVFAMRGSTQGSPVFSPNGNKVAFVSNKDGPPRIYVMDVPRPGANVKGLQPKLITRVNRENSAPAWSPDGTKLAYCAKTDTVRQIWIYDFNTEKEHQLTHGDDNKENPTWAPNSRHIIFNSASETRSELYLVNLNQPEAVRISNGPGEKRFPSWEPRIF